MNITVRPMENTDYESVHQVDILTQKQYLGQEFEKMSQEEQEKHLVSRKSEFKINVDTGYCFVAEENRKVVGFILAHETLPFHGTLYIHYIGLNPDCQGKGIGLLLYEALVRKAKQSGVKKIWALINFDNPKSIRLHIKAGFKLSDRKEAVLEL